MIFGTIALPVPSTNMTDEANIYVRLGREFAAHKAVDHSRAEYAYFDRATNKVVSTNAAEKFFSILKRGVTGTYHSISEAHLHRNLKSSISGTTTAPALASMRSAPTNCSGASKASD